MEFKLNTLLENGIIDSNKVTEVICNGEKVWKGLSDDLSTLSEDYEFIKFNKDEDNSFNKPVYKIEVNSLHENRLPENGEDPQFGIPEKEKYPLFDKSHVLSAIKFFNYVDGEDEAKLAHAIIAKMKKYGIDNSHVGENNKLSKYLSESVNLDEEGNTKIVDNFAIQKAQYEQKKAEDAKKKAELDSKVNEKKEVLSDEDYKKAAEVDKRREEANWRKQNYNYTWHNKNEEDDYAKQYPDDESLKNNNESMEIENNEELTESTREDREFNSARDNDNYDKVEKMEKLDPGVRDSARANRVGHNVIDNNRNVSDSVVDLGKESKDIARAKRDDKITDTKNRDKYFKESIDVADPKGDTQALNNVRSDLQGELTAIKDYEEHADNLDKLDMKDAANVLRDIAKEEKVHCGELQAVLDKYDDENKAADADGRKEADEELEEALFNIVSESIAEYITEDLLVEGLTPVEQAYKNATEENTKGAHIGHKAVKINEIISWILAPFSFGATIPDAIVSDIWRKKFNSRIDKRNNELIDYAHNKSDVSALVKKINDTNDKIEIQHYVNQLSKLLSQYYKEMENKKKQDSIYKPSKLVKESYNK